MGPSLLAYPVSVIVAVDLHGMGIQFARARPAAAASAAELVAEKITTEIGHDHV